MSRFPMIGTILNSAAILVGGGIGLTAQKQISPKFQVTMKLLMGAFTIIVGFKTTFKALHGSGTRMLAEIGIVFLSLILGRLVGRILRLQKVSNKAGEFAKEMMSKNSGKEGLKFSDGFVTCTLLFCVGPMAIIGSIQDGTTGDFSTLAIKAVMDGMATMVFATLFGWGTLMSALPVFAYQGSITLLAQRLSPYLQDEALMNSINATGGMMIVFIAVVILEIRKVELADYLPSLIIAPLLTWWWIL